jgi:LysM repeat protein
MIKLLVIIGFSFFNSPAEKDSVGVETINGKTFVLHRVEEKETLFAISRRYGTPVDAIVESNADAASGLEIGQIIKVPYTPKQQRAADGLTHKVAPKETLFSISKLYGISLDELKQWNNLTDNSLVIGQALIVRKKNVVATPTTYRPEQTAKVNSTGMHTVAQGETMYAIARQHNITVDQLKQWNTLTGNEISIGQSLYVSQPSVNNTTVRTNTPVTTTAPPTPQETVNNNTTQTSPRVEQRNDAPVNKPEVKEQPVKEQTIKISESVRNGDEIIEAGVAELIDGTEGNRKYLALHRTAPVGTILKVRNEMNNREVFVRVMGKLPETALTDKLVIKVSKSAYDRLGAIDPKFRVEVTYYK